MAKKIEKAAIPLLLFSVALIAYLSIDYTLADFDDYYYFFGALNIFKYQTYLVDGSPPQFAMGYSLLFIPFFFIFGTAVRAGIYPAALFGALTVVLLYSLTKKLIDKRAALIAPLFMIFSNHWALSTVIMAEVPALFFMLLSLYAAMRYVKTEKPLFAYLFYFSAGFAILIRYTSALVFIIVGLYLLLSKKVYLLKKKEVWLGFPICLLILLPQLIFNHIHYGSPFRTGYYWQERMFSLEKFATAGDRRPPFQIISYLKYIVFGFGTPLFPFFIYGLWTWLKEKRREQALIFPWLVLPLLTFCFYWFHSLRFIILILPPFLIVSGLGFSKIYETFPLKKKFIKETAFISAVILLLLPTAFFQLELIQRREAGSACLKNTFLWVRDNSRQDDIILSFPYPTYEYYAQRKVYSLQDPHQEIKKLIAKHNNAYIVLRETWRQQKFRQEMFAAKQRLDAMYGLDHLKTFECALPLSWTTRLFYAVIRKAGIYTSQAGVYSSASNSDRWDVYLLRKNDRFNRSHHSTQQ